MYKEHREGQVMPVWHVAVDCPFHKKTVILSIEASDSTEASARVIGMSIPCSWGPIERVEKRVRTRVLKDFAEGVFKFKAGEEHEVDVETSSRWATVGYAVPISEPVEKVTKELHFFVVEKAEKAFPPWTPPAVLVGPEKKLGVISSLAEVPERPVTVPVPKEALYTLPRDLVERLRGKTAWWDYKEESEKVVEKWREVVLKSFKEHEEKLRRVKEEHERRLAEVRITTDKAERERKMTEVKEWRLAKGTELENGLIVLWERASTPVDAITVVQAERWKEIMELLKRVRGKQAWELGEMEKEELVK